MNVPEGKGGKKAQQTTCRGDYDALGSKWNKSMWDNMESKYIH